ncbi:unconventional myosin-XVI-like [Frankliniella occidentalis]|uniref:Unconventional myosin-XVI-like n=1 Tax=Frankliniella occidentalis TaxID=133901 RepID=A0A9C6U2D3_FRAOC|nr:unconventional myosin-XVI-like [Frankliniella occidentalis]
MRPAPVHHIRSNCPEGKQISLDTMRAVSVILIVAAAVVGLSEAGCLRPCGPPAPPACHGPPALPIFLPSFSLPSPCGGSAPAPSCGGCGSSNCGGCGSAPAPSCGGQIVEITRTKSFVPLSLPKLPKPCGCSLPAPSCCC